jgi:hypothetical protein
MRQPRRSVLDKLWQNVERRPRRRLRRKPALSLFRRRSWPGLVEQLTRYVDSSWAEAPKNPDREIIGERFAIGYTHVCIGRNEVLLCFAQIGTRSVCCA